MNTADALRLIAAKSPDQMRNAIRTLQSVLNDTPIAVQRAQKVISWALQDPQGEFTTDERAALAALLGGSDTRTLDVRVRVTPAEKAGIQAMADEAGLTVSDFIRRGIGL